MRWLLSLVFAAATVAAAERQLTHSARNHALDNNDNFSPDDRYLCVDTRGSGQAILRIDTRSGEESTIFGAGPTVIAASYHPKRDEVIFIHGPVGEPYVKTNRRGGVVGADGAVRFLDYRDVASAVTPPGAHRGGTHRHEYNLEGTRVGFTYDDHLLPSYGRTVGMLVAHPQAPKGHWWFANLVPIVPEASAKPGDMVMAAGDSWVGAKGLMRAFIGRVKEADGTFRNSLFVVDVPANVDVTTAFAGDRTQYPRPPRGTRIRRLTTGEASGIVRGTRDGKWIAYVAADASATKQVFVIPSQGGTPKQVTHAPGGVQGGMRWHPSDTYLAASTANGIVVTNWTTGKSVSLTEKGGDALVWSNDGKTLAFNRKVGEHLQVFVVPFTAGGF